MKRDTKIKGNTFRFLLIWVAIFTELELETLRVLQMWDLRNSGGSSANPSFLTRAFGWRGRDYKYTRRQIGRLVWNQYSDMNGCDLTRIFVCVVTRNIVATPLACCEPSRTIRQALGPLVCPAWEVSLKPKPIIGYYLGYLSSSPLCFLLEFPCSLFSTRIKIFINDIFQFWQMIGNLVVLVHLNFPLNL